jgi:hypothetical protein
VSGLSSPYKLKLNEYCYRKIADLAKQTATGPKKTEGFALGFRRQIEMNKRDLQKELRDSVKRT